MKLPSLKSHPLFNCGNPSCALCSKAYSRLKVEKKIIKKDFQSDAVSPFVGRFNYPNISVGILAPPEETSEAWLYDAPKYWAVNNFQIPQIIDYRSSLINSSFKANIRQRTKFLQLSQEAAMSSKPTDIEINLEDNPKFRLNVDSILGNYLVKEIKKYNQVNYCAFFGSYLGNYYLILLFPEIWSYELFETPVSDPEHFTTDYEFYEGRKYYADNTAGGYYTVMLAILENLNEMKKQASVLALRFITGDYTLPLGVWVTREAARNAMSSAPIEFSSKELMLEYAKKLVKKRFNCDAGFYFKRSKIIREIKSQSKLMKFL